MKTNIQTSNQNMKHRNQNKNSYDHYGKCTCIRSRTYTLVKTNVRTPRYKSILNMGVSNTNHACHRTNKHDIWHNEH